MVDLHLPEELALDAAFWVLTNQFVPDQNVSASQRRPIPQNRQFPAGRFHESGFGGWRWDRRGRSLLRLGTLYLDARRLYVRRMSAPFEFQISTDQSPPENEKMPSYSDRGRILVEIEGPGSDDPSKYPRYELTVYDYDGDSSLMWLNEGIGIEYWINEEVEFWIPGWYVIEDVHGHYYRGTWGFDDDDEEWYHGEVRPATAEEIACGHLIGPQPTSALPTTSPSSS